MAVFASLLPPAFVPALQRRLARKKRRGRLMAELAATGESYRRRLWVIPFGIVGGAGSHAMNVLAFWAVGRALFGTHVPTIGAHFRIVPLVLFSTAIPLPFGAGLGRAKG